MRITRKEWNELFPDVAYGARLSAEKIQAAQSDHIPAARLGKIREHLLLASTQAGEAIAQGLRANQKFLTVTENAGTAAIADNLKPKPRSRHTRSDGPQGSTANASGVSAVAAEPGLGKTQIIAESSVEVEMRLEKAIGLVTTKDGSLGAILLPKLQYVLPEFVERKRVELGLPTIRAIPFESFTLAERLELVQKVCFDTNRKRTERWPEPAASFHEGTNRAIFGLVPKPDLGAHGASLLPLVEYAYDSMPYIEVHFRDRMSAGDLSRTARELLDEQGIPPQSQHVHMTAPVPLARQNQADNREIALAMANFVLLANMAAEMRSVVDFGVGLHTKDLVGGATGFDCMSADAGWEVFRYFDPATTHLVADRLANELKLGFVGFHSHKKYDTTSHDQPGTRVWGLQYRDLAREVMSEDSDALLNDLHADMVAMARPGATAPEWFSEWYASHQDAVAAGDADRVCQALYYNQPWGRLLDNLPAELGVFREMLTTKAGEWAEDLDFRGAEQHMETKMLVFDWSTYPVIHDRPGMQARIRQEQQVALSRIANGMLPTEAVKYFLQQSGVANLIRSLVGSAG